MVNAHPLVEFFTEKWEKCEFISLSLRPMLIAFAALDLDGEDDAPGFFSTCNLI